MISSYEHLENLLDKDPIEEFPSLGEIKEVAKYARSKQRYKRETIYYMLLMYSDKSFFNLKKSQMTLEHRRMKAAQLVGFPKKQNGEFITEIVSGIFNLENDRFFDMLFAFLKAQDNNRWRQIVYTESMLDEYLRVMGRPLEVDEDKDLMTAMKNKSAVRSEVDKMLSDLNRYYDEFYKDNDDVRQKRKRRSLESRAKVPG
jgi:hypothetical protein